MARVVVVGGGFGGLAAAARLAKLGHEVTLLERAATLGGAVSSVTADGFVWDAGPTSTLLPAVIRDLFRKSGRPVEKELDLVPLEHLREHRFQDGSRVALPGGSRTRQRHAVEGLGPGLGERWVRYVDSYASQWELLRRDYLERPWHPDLGHRDVARLLAGRSMLDKRLRSELKDERLRLLASHPFAADGHDSRNVPAWQGVTAYVEQSFGSWTVPGGMAGLTTALAKRLETRGVAVRTGVEVRDVVLREGRVAAVVADDVSVDTDMVVCAVDPRRLPVLARHLRRTLPAIPPAVCHLGLEGDVPGLPREVVLHGDPLLVVRTGGQAPEGRHAWTVHLRGRSSDDVVVALARLGIDVGPHLLTRIDRSPRALMDAWGGSPLGVLWQGRGTVRHRLGPSTPVPGVYVAGAHVVPGAGLAYVGLSAALVAQAIGPA